jgi:hypothetical protein
MHRGDAMKSGALTLRNLPPALHRRIRRLARERRISLNRAVIELLEQRAVEPAAKPPHDDLDFLVGAWSADEAAAFEEELARQRTIDPELWK